MRYEGGWLQSAGICNEGGGLCREEWEWGGREKKPHSWMRLCSSSPLHATTILDAFDFRVVLSHFFHVCSRHLRIGGPRAMTKQGAICERGEEGNWTAVAARREGKGWCLWGAVFSRGEGLSVHTGASDTHAPRAHYEAASLVQRGTRASGG
jgi:hypothetical protein